MTDMTNEETVQQICQYIEGNVFCSAEEHCRAMEYQLDRIDKKLNGIVRFLKRRVKPLLDELDNEARNSKH